MLSCTGSWSKKKIAFSSLPSMHKRGHKNSYSSLYNMASTEERNSRSHSNQMYDREMILKNSFTEWNEKEHKQANNEQNALSQSFSIPYLKENQVRFSQKSPEFKKNDSSYTANSKSSDKNSIYIVNKNSQAFTESLYRGSSLSFGSFSNKPKKAAP